ncbi:hypothetical protein N7481_003952 [Penicillium waksmanii]|uniref:uncharacterized protein n=1 Tax=Penicillium waksmanii TaxID=69791 RepID=UPI0025470599|nr:uncharacterized protein N7481_003952 [Penicillium waksmanii]KAJ5988742.1 hypothetical protein N7481_003952 [Penicillium waksmanii]
MVISGSLFLSLNGLWAVWSINSYLASVLPLSTIAIAVREIIQFFFTTGTYLGLGLCFWRFPLQVAIDQEDDPAINPTRLLGPVEADSRKVLPEADASRPVVEADGTNPILEADSTTTHKKP